MCSSDLGWTYKVITAATYAGVVCEIGDMIIALVDRAGSGNVNADWTVVQSNLDGAVTSVASGVTAGNLPAWDGTSGKILKNGYTVQSEFSSSTTAIPTSSAIFNAYSALPRMQVTTMPAAATATVYHGLGTKDLVVSIREVATDIQVDRKSVV